MKLNIPTAQEAEEAVNALQSARVNEYAAKVESAIKQAVREGRRIAYLPAPIPARIRDALQDMQYRVTVQSSGRNESEVTVEW